MPSLFGLALLGVYRLLFPWEFINATIAGGPHIRELLALAGLFVVQQAVMFGRYWFRVAASASELCSYSSTRQPLPNPDASNINPSFEDSHLGSSIPFQRSRAFHPNRVAHSGPCARSPHELEQHFKFLRQKGKISVRPRRTRASRAAAGNRSPVGASSAICAAGSAALKRGEPTAILGWLRSQGFTLERPPRINKRIGKVAILPPSNIPFFRTHSTAPPSRTALSLILHFERAENSSWRPR